MTTAAETFLRRSIPPSMRGPGWDLVIGVAGTSEQANWDLAADVEDQLFESTASGKYLSRLGSRSGISPPKGVGMPDDSFRELLIAINSAQLTPDAMLAVLEIFYGLAGTHAFSTSSVQQSFDISDQSTLTFRFDGRQVVTVVFDAADYQGATAAEVSATLNRAFIQAGSNALALPYTDWSHRQEDNTLNVYLRVYTGTPGLGGSVEILGGSAQRTFGFITNVANIYSSSYSCDVTTAVSGTRYWLSGAGASAVDLIRAGDIVEIVGGFNAANQGEFTVARVYKTAARNLQPNAGFETSTLAPGVWADGWTYYNNNQAGEAITGSVVAGRTGNCQRVTWAVSSTGVKGIENQGGDLAGVQGGWRAGHRYLVSFWARASGGAVGHTMTLGWNTAPGSVAFSSNPSTSGSFQHYQAEVIWTQDQPVENVVSGGLFISISGTGFTGSVDFDDLSVSDVGQWFEVENSSGVAESGITTGALSFYRPAKNLLVDNPVAAYVEKTDISRIVAVLPATAGVVTRSPGSAAYLRQTSLVPINNATVSGDRQSLTINTGLPHGLSVGNQVIIDGLLPSIGGAGGGGGGVNGTFEVVGGVDTYDFVVKPCDGATVNLVPSTGAADTGVTLTADVSLAPDGTVTATAMSYDGTGASSAERARWTNNTPSVSDAEYVAGIWLRSPEPLILTLYDGYGTLTCNVTTQWQYFSFSEVPVRTYVKVVLLSNGADNTPFLVYLWEPFAAVATQLDCSTGSLTIVAAPTAPDGAIDAVIYDPVAGLRVTESVTTTTAKLDARRGYQFLGVADSTQFPDQPGWLVIGLGYCYQAGPVRYLGRSGGGQLMLDPGYKFAAVVPTNTVVNLLTGPTPGQPSHPESGAFYLTSSPAGRVAAEDIIDNLAAVGVDVEVDVQYPGDRGLAGEGLPTSGQQRLAGVVDAFAGDTVDEEVAAARTAI